MVDCSHFTCVLVVGCWSLCTYHLVVGEFVARFCRLFVRVLLLVTGYLLLVVDCW